MHVVYQTHLTRITGKARATIKIPNSTRFRDALKTGRNRARSFAAGPVQVQVYKNRLPIQTEIWDRIGGRWVRKFAEYHM